MDGKYLFRLEKRTLDDIRTLGVNSPEDDARFAALARLSEINVGLYRTFWQPWIRASMTEPTAEAMRAMHPNRLRFGLFSDQNPFTQAVKPLTEAVRANRTPVSPDNPLLAMEKAASSWITTCLESWGGIRDGMTEAFFLNAYGSPLLQAMVGLGGPEETPRRIERDLVREAAAAELRSSLERKFEEGGLEEAALRALIYVRLPDGAFDERSFRMLKGIREQRKSNDRITRSQFRDILNDSTAARSARRGARDRGRAQAPQGRRGRHRRDVERDAPTRRGARRARSGRVSAAGRGSRSCSARNLSQAEAERSEMSDAATRTTSVSHDKYDRLIAAAQKETTIKVAVAHPCDEVSLRGVVEASEFAVGGPHPCRSGGASAGSCRAIEHRHQCDRAREFRA